MTKGTRITSRTPESELADMRGARVTQVAIPDEQHAGFRLHNVDGIVSSIARIGDGLSLVVDNDAGPLVFTSAVLTHE